MEHALSAVTLDQPVLNPEAGKGLRARVAEYSARTGALARKFAKAAAPVVAGAGLQYAFKTAAVGTAVAAGANIYGAAFVGGATVTVVGAARDYRKFRREQEQKSTGFFGIIRDFFRFLGGRKKEYGTKLLKNTGLSALGAGFIDNFDSIREGAGKALDFVRERVDLSSLLSISSAQAKGLDFPPVSDRELAAVGQFSPEDEPQPEAAETAIVSEPAPQEMAQAPQPADFKTVLKTLDTSGWSKQALGDLKAAQAGKLWAIQNLAHYSANGLQGLPRDVGLARTFAEEGASRNYRLSTRFLADLDRISPAQPLVVAAAPAPAPVMPAPVAPVVAEIVPEIKPGIMPEIVQQPLAPVDGVVTQAVPDVAPIVFSELKSPEAATFYGEKVVNTITCREVFGNAAVRASFECPQMKEWLGPGGAVVLEQDSGERKIFVNRRDEPVWGPNFTSAVVGGQLSGDWGSPEKLIAGTGPVLR